MNKLDLIIAALENSEPTGTGWVHIYEQKHQAALAAARELRALKPVAYMDSKGVLFNKTTHPHLNTALYALAQPKIPMSPEHLPQYIATNNIKPTTEGGGGAGGEA